MPLRDGEPEAERRQLTVLFSDLVESTVLADALDPEDLREIERAHHTACASVIARLDGYVAQYIGDGVLAYFGYPVAHEDDARRAVQAALGILEAMAAVNTRFRAERQLELSVRLGIHTGPVVVGEVGDSQRRENLALGRTLHLAARIETFAQPNTVVVSDETYRIVRGFFDVEPLGAHRLKGLAEPVVMHRVLRVTGAESRLEAGRRTGLTALTGRARERASLEDFWRAIANGDGPAHTVLVHGEAGIGKSRIVASLRETVDAQRYRTIECSCTAYSQHSPLYPIIAWAERTLGFDRSVPDADKWTALEREFDRRGIGTAEALQSVGQLLGVSPPAGRTLLPLPPQRQRERTLEALREWLMAVAHEGPTLFILEDLHWADPTTLEFVTAVAASASNAPLLTILTCRSDFAVPGLSGQVSVLALGRLDRDDTRAMIVRVAKDKPLPEEVLRQLIARTEGVPLFVEEVTKAALELGMLAERTDRYELTGPLPPDLIPATVEGSLIARLDRLGSAKFVAQVAATLGREFRLDVLQAVVTLEGDALDQALRRLQAAELIFQVRGAADTTYVFKHALIQDAAYQSLLKKSRRDHHRRIGETLVERFPDIVEQRPELIAQHFGAGGDADRATAFWLRAGQRAIARAAHHEAIAHMSRALEQLRELPESRSRDERELECNMVLTPALQMTRGWASHDMDGTFRRSVALVERLGDTPHRLLVLGNSAAFHVMRGHVWEALALGRQLREHATAIGLPPLDVMGAGICCVAHLYHGSIAEAIADGEAALALAPQASEAIVSMVGMAAESYITCYLSEALWMHGLPDQALQCSQRAVTAARERTHAPSEEFAVGYQAMFFHLLRDPDRILAVVEDSLRLAELNHSTFWEPVNTTYRGWALSVQGRVDEGIELMRDGLARYRAGGHGLSQVHMLAALADALASAERWDEALAAVAEAMEVATRTGEAYFEPEVYRLRGEILRRLAAGDQGPARTARLATAELSIRQALVMAQQQQAKSLELRAAMSLCLVQRERQGDADGARLLADVLGSFTEGYDTPDLRDARALLAESSSEAT
jgi:class 3 adenylate cyclase/predicted ATPase